MANTITGFSVVQSISVSIAFGSSLSWLQDENIVVQATIASIIVLFIAGYLMAVETCHSLAIENADGDPKIWNPVNRGRVAPIFLFGLIPLSGLFAKDTLGQLV